MEVNESTIITFLAIVIIILIFSKIDFVLPSSSTISTSAPNVRTISTEAPIEEEDDGIRGFPSDPEPTQTLPSDLKRKLQMLEDRFYYDNCQFTRV